MSDRVTVRALPLLLVSSDLVRQVGAFLLVGGIGWIVDVGIFNVLRATVLDPVDVHGGAMIAKAISTAVAIGLNWVGNRTLAFRGRRSRSTAAEAGRFVAASLLGAAVSLLCLLVSHDLLGLTSALADNISANVVGLLLGTALRFVLYRAWVFTGRPAAAAR